MRLWMKVLAVCFLTSAFLGQSPLGEPTHFIRVRELVIESDVLSAADRQSIISSFREKTFPESEIAERVRQALTSMGYFKAIVKEPKVFFETERKEAATVMVAVSPGTQYRLGEISFRRVTV